MKKHLVLLLAVSSLVFFNTGCTSKKSEADVEVVENADVEKIEVTDTVQATDPSLDVAMQSGATTTTEAPLETTTTTVTTAEGTEVPPSPEITETPVNTETTVTTTETSELVETPVDQTVTLTDGTQKSGITDIAPTETATVTTSESSAGGELTETPITDSGAVASALTEENVAVSMKKPKKRRYYAPTVSAAPSEKAEAPVAQKASIGGDKRLAEIQPYQTADGGWINTVYFVRPTETFAQISDKIFKADKKEELSAIAENAYLKKREVKDGDKIYYVSPNRPDDSARMMIYQEDVGMVPETYIAKEGENFKNISKDLLGFDSGWKEVWFSNSNSSNKKFKEGEVVRYWKLNTPPEPMAVADNSAQTLPAPPADANATMPAPPADASAPTLDANGQPIDPNAAAPTDINAAPPPPPPPPPTEEVAQAPKVNLDEEAAVEEEGQIDSNTMMSMGALGVLVAALAYLIIRKKRQKEAANSEINA